jgi:hypothetical protein
MQCLALAQSQPTLLSAHHQQTISALHPLPIMFICSSTNETDLIVLVTGTESWPTKLMGAKFSDDPLQKCHVCPPLSHGPDSVALDLFWKRRVNRFLRMVPFGRTDGLKPTSMPTKPKILAFLDSKASGAA